MNGGPSGFNNAPITRAFVVSCVIFTIVFGIQGRSNKLGFSYQVLVNALSTLFKNLFMCCVSPLYAEISLLFGPKPFRYTDMPRFPQNIVSRLRSDIFKKLQLWKLVLSVFSFSSTPELMFGAYLLYYFRVFERQIGSNKYSVFILFSLVVSSLLEVLVIALLKDPSLNLLTSGPYGLIFSAFVPFFFDIPVSTRFRVFSLRFSDKSFVYLAGLQLLLSSWKRSIIPGICGILAGSLYRLNVFYTRRMKFPEFIASFFSRLSWPSVRSTSPASPTRNALGNVPPYAGRQVEVNHPAPVSFTSEPPEDSIATLVSMGFDRSSARQALIHARNDINTATNILLESQSH